MKSSSLLPVFAYKCFAVVTRKFLKPRIVRTFINNWGVAHHHVHAPNGFSFPSFGMNSITGRVASKCGGEPICYDDGFLRSGCAVLNCTDGVSGVEQDGPVSDNVEVTKGGRKAQGQLSRRPEHHITRQWNRHRVVEVTRIAERVVRSSTRWSRP